jgi:DNA polymerase-3 subunit epsilon
MLALDTETTGVNPWEARIVTCSMVYDDGQGSPQRVFDWIIDPGIEIPEGASNVHGITTEKARAEGVPAADGVRQIAAHLEPIMNLGIPLNVYNASYDLTLLLSEFERHDVYFPYEFNRVIDPLVIDKQIDKYRKGKRQLAVTAALMNYDLTNAHSADADCKASIAVARGFGTKYTPEAKVEEIYYDTIDEIHEKQIEWKRQQAEGLQSYFRRTKNDPTIVINGEWPYERTQRDEP